MKGNTSGFSLLELLVVMAVISIFASIAIIGLNESQSQSRDAKRLADLRLVENAVELFKNKYGHYPSGCNASTTDDTTTVWSGEEGTGEECSVGNEYIVNLAPEFIPRLPRDPRAGQAGNSGYVYTTNDNGTVFKFMAMNSVEGETVDQLHDFYRCGNFAQGGNLGSNDTWEDAGMCFRSRTHYNGGASAHITTFSECTAASVYQDDYAVSGGYSTDDRGANISSDKGREFDTEIVRCK